MRITRRVPVRLERAFAIVDDVEKYPEFLPDVKRVRVLEQRGDERLVEIEFRHPVLSARQKSWARSEPPRSIVIEQIEGLSKEFRLCWRFEPLGESSTEITAELEIEFDSRLLSAVLGRAMEKMIEEMIARFENRMSGPNPRKSS
jgi:ribosome-associated toxin RatA of RatAB toxin-antitoxin module